MKYNLLLLCILICGALTMNAESKALIKNVWIETNVEKNDQPGLAIHFDFDLSGAKDKLIGCQAMFFSRPGGWALRDKNNKYRLSPSLNYVAAFDYFRAKTNDQKIENMSIFIPAEELHLNYGHRYRIYVQLSIYSDPGKNGEFLAESDYLPVIIDMTNPNTIKSQPDFSGSVTVAEAEEAAKKRRNGEVATARPVVTKDPNNPNATTSPEEPRTTWSSKKIKRVSIDPATFWTKQEVDSASLPKVYIE
ncbi:MAG: hypothetical protein NC127_06505 [Muribaculum sp.]|nr:hypothetical protein [Muribaculum sp.]